RYKNIDQFSRKACHEYARDQFNHLVMSKKYLEYYEQVFFFSSRRRHTRFSRDWSSDVCSSDLDQPGDQRHKTEPLQDDTKGAGDEAAPAQDKHPDAEQNANDAIPTCFIDLNHLE